jgi:hypothetical protein
MSSSARADQRQYTEMQGQPANREGAEEPAEKVTPKTRLALPFTFGGAPNEQRRGFVRLLHRIRSIIGLFEKILRQVPLFAMLR